jgi:hypothetical protein
MRRSRPTDGPRRYRITIQGHLTEHWESWFDGMQIESRPAPDGHVQTTVTGTLADQSALQGALRALHGLGLTLLTVETLEEEADG